MNNFARYFYHIGKNLILKNYRYFRITGNIRGRIFFFDRDRRTFFSIKSRGFIDSVTANQIYSNNEYNFSFVGRRDQAMSIYRDILISGRVPVIIDCGANIGLSPQYFHREFPDAQVVAVEPDIENFRIAQDNCSGLHNITLYQAAIGSQPGFVQIDNQGADANAFQVSRTGSDNGIQVRTIPDLLSETPNASLFIVKVDIEGFERDLFADNISWIDQCNILIVELHDWMLPGQASSANFIKALGGRDRDLLFKGESVFSIKNTQRELV